jgi:hypothetical protein
MRRGVGIIGAGTESVQAQAFESADWIDCRLPIANLYTKLAAKTGTAAESLQSANLSNQQLAIGNRQCYAVVIYCRRSTYHATGVMN